MRTAGIGPRTEPVRERFKEAKETGPPEPTVGATGGCLIHDLTGRILEVDGPLCGILEYPREELLGMSCGMITVPDYAIEVFANIKTMAMEGAFVFRSFLTVRSGRLLPAVFRSAIERRDGALVITSVATVFPPLYGCPAPR